MRTLLVLLWASLLPLAGLAGPTDPIVLERPDDTRGEAQIPGFRTLADLPAPYVDEEFFIAGEATVYTYEEEPRRGVVIPRDEGVPYRTRILVRRPADAADANGTVVIEWWNSTAGFDTAPTWDASSDFFAREGWTYVGITNSNTSIDFLRGRCLLAGILPVAACRDRYETLSMPENGQAYDVVSQLVHAMREGGVSSPLPPETPVERVFHTGQSQQGASVITYASDFHFPGNDGYFPQVAASGRPINFAAPTCGSDGAPPYPDCTPALEGGDRFVRTDLPVPVVHVLSETDVASPFGGIAQGSRQADTRTYRYYEMAGATHVAIHRRVDVIPGVLRLREACLNRLNTHSDGPIFGAYLMNAMWKNLERQVRDGVPPPKGKVIEIEDGAIARDEFGNALGGLRLPEMDLPVATYQPNNTVDVDAIPPILVPAIPLLDLFCRLTGSVFPFDAETLAELYPSGRRYEKRYRQRLVNLVARRHLLPEDAAKLEAALQAPVP
ncbi:MAG: alpha/beta hydrolase domain-containing protein [Myxococcota bacterium]